MPIDWDAFDASVDAAIGRAAAQTDDDLATEVSSLTTMTNAQIKELFPEPADLKRLAELMRIVKSAEDDNAKIARIAENGERFAGTVLKIAGRLT
jgi:hypothetical protein